MSVRSLTDDKMAAWDDFVQSSPQGTFFHLSGWKKVMEAAFGFKTHYMYTEQAGAPAGVLPLAHVKKPLFGACLISTPLCVHGGPIGEGGELLSAAADTAKDLNVGYMELRKENDDASGIASDAYFSFKRPLAADDEEILKAIPRKQRAEVRKGMKAELEVTHDQGLDRFYRIYATSVRNLGTPVFPKKYLAALCDVFGEDCEITTVSKNGHALASVLSFYYRDQVLPYYGGGLPEARRYSAYPFMYWAVMRRAAERGATVFDFGRSMAGSGAYAFKKNFGFEPEPLVYTYRLITAQTPPDLTANNPRNEFISRVWKRMPLPVANLVGPYLYPVIV